MHSLDTLSRPTCLPTHQVSHTPETRKSTALRYHHRPATNPTANPTPSTTATTPVVPLAPNPDTSCPNPSIQRRRSLSMPIRMKNISCTSTAMPCAGIPSSFELLFLGVLDSTLLLPISSSAPGRESRIRAQRWVGHDNEGHSRKRKKRTK
ncbi:hypothetical protein VDGD_20234 [Verticillium dahliae]|nr:hypothetical protein VDGD_20234 [Verticillium dahliae]